MSHACLARPMSIDSVLPQLSALRLRIPGTVVSLIAAVVLMTSVRADETNIEDVSYLSTETKRTFARADRAIKDLDGYLTALKFQKSAFIGTNYFGVSVGGIDAIRDLEEGRGVDPETLAALYSGFAIPVVSEHLNMKHVRNDAGQLELKIVSVDGRLRYKGAVVRMYSPDTLRELFDRRNSFRIDNERKRKEIFANYVYKRRKEVGNLDSSGQASESSELARRFEELQPLLGELDPVLQAESSASTILGGAGPQHFFGISVAGIDVVKDLSERHAIDPESYAAIYADRVAIDYADFFKIVDGRIFYQDNEIKMYSTETLESYFKRRDRLTIRTATP